MFQDIGPYNLKNQFNPKEITNNDYIVVYNNDQIMLRKTEENISIPKYGEIIDHFSIAQNEIQYLFSIDDIGFFLSIQNKTAPYGFEFNSIQVFRTMEPSWLAFAGATSIHLARWYSSHRYCGKCASIMKHDENERAVYCSKCGNKEYPKISPVIIVGIIHEDKLLLTKYANAEYKRHALVAGFMEIGETLEDTVRREVMEEVGLKVKNIRYYKSQPWAFSESVLMGFFADVDGDAEVHVDGEELSEAQWFSRKDLPAEDTTLSLTWDMIEFFRNK